MGGVGNLWELLSLYSRRQRPQSILPAVATRRRGSIAAWCCEVLQANHGNLDAGLVEHANRSAWKGHQRLASAAAKTFLVFSSKKQSDQRNVYLSHRQNLEIL